MSLNCPRCGFEASYLVPVYYDSKWNNNGGLCSRCCTKAAKHFDLHDWPEPKEQQ